MLGPADKDRKGLSGELAMYPGDPIHGILQANWVGEFTLPIDLVLDRRIVFSISGVARPE